MASPGSIGSAMPPSEDTQVRKFADLERFVRELGPSVAQSLATTVKTLQDLVAQVTATLVNINATVTASIAANSMTTAQIQSLVAAPPSVASSGPVSGTTGTFPTGMSSVGVYNKLLSYGGSYSSQYVHQDGTMGYAPSSRQYKRDIADSTLTPEKLTALRLVTFRYIAAFENLGDAADVEVGVIAEEVHDLGLHWLVDYGRDGLPMGVKYERMVLLLIPWAKSIEARLDAAGI